MSTPRMVHWSTVFEGGFVLTNMEWHPATWFGDIAQYETGILQVAGENFTLVQHGWDDFEAADALILRALAKGWDTGRINDLMNWMRDQ